MDSEIETGQLISSKIRTSKIVKLDAEIPGNHDTTPVVGNETTIVDTRGSIFVAASHTAIPLEPLPTKLITMVELWEQAVQRYRQTVSFQHAEEKVFSDCAVVRSGHNYFEKVVMQWGVFRRKS